ncbi:hypothetical protein [Pseudomonas sp. Irchel 3E19]|uniref:hypothetical protein n=1 Tax=Pseudomonas sp. Irchel 3E19 TaxID=2008981 RepID=UPI0014827085|nr:hypothetical protein [Pseudomonas sp. Irchel 3E19]
MDIQSAVLNQLFVLFPVIIQGWITPVRPAGIAHGGIPQVLYDGQLQGLLCLIDPWTELQRQSWTMAVDDRVDLYINDNTTPVTGTTVKPGEEAQRLRLYIPHGYLRQGVNRLHYKVFRVGGNTSEDSRDLLVLYHLRTPDNLDIVIPADVINEGVSAERAAQGVEFRFTYNNRRPYDRIRLLIGDTEVTFDVADGNAPITHTLFTDAFLAAGNNPSAVIQFFVFDQLGNPSKSPEKRLDIHLEAETFDSPILRERLDDTGDDKTEIDLEKLAGNPLLIIVPTSDSRFQVGDLIYVTYICKVTGQPDVVVTPPAGTVEADEFGQRKPCVVEVPNEHVIADGAVTVTYKVHRANGDAVGSSRVARAQVIGEALPAATLVFTNGPYEVLAGKTFDVGLLLTRDGVPQANVVVTLRLASGFQFPGGGGGERDFITDAKGVVTVTGIIASGAEGGHELVAKSKGASDVVARVEVLAEGPVGLIDIGELPYTIAISKDGTRIFVNARGRIVEIDPVTNRVVGVIPTGITDWLSAMVITPDNKKIYGTHYNQGIQVFNTTTRRIIKTIPVISHYLSLSPDGSRLASSIGNNGNVTMIETVTDTVTGTLSTSAFNGAQFNSDGSRILAMSGSLQAVNSETGAVINSYTIPVRSGIGEIGLSPDGTRIYILLYDVDANQFYTYGTIVELEAKTLRPIRNITVSGRLTPHDGQMIISTIFTDRILLTHPKITTAIIIDLVSGKEVGHFEMVHPGPSRMVYTPNQKRLYVCNINSRYLDVFPIDQ